MQVPKTADNNSRWIRVIRAIRGQRFLSNNLLSDDVPSMILVRARRFGSGKPAARSPTEKVATPPRPLNDMRRFLNKCREPLTVMHMVAGLVLFAGIAVNTAWFASMRASVFRPSLPLIGFALMLTGLFACTVWLAVDSLPIPRRRRIARTAVIATCFLAAIGGMEIWFTYEEVSFQREIQVRRDARSYARQRWDPFDSYDLYYDDGVFHAND